MNARLALILVAVFALALGATGGYFAGRESLEDTHPRRIASNFCSPDPGGNESVKPRTNEPGPRSNGERKPTPEPRPTDPTLKGIIDSIKIDAPPKGTGKITGSVRKPDGTGVAGVKITARLQNPKTPATKEDPTIEDEIENVIRRRRYEEATSCISKSDAEGRFVIEGLRDESHVVFAELKGFQIYSADWRVTNNARPGAVIEFVAKPVARATIDVLMPDGSHPENAYISWIQRSGNGANSNYGQAWTPNDREFEREFGPWEVRAYSGAHQEYASETVTVTIEADREAPSVTLQLKERPGIKGKLILASGDSPTEIWVNALFYEGDPPDELKFIKRRGGGGRYRGHEGNWGGLDEGDDGSGAGSYAFLDLKPGKYLLGAVRGLKLVASMTVMVGAALVNQDLTIPELQRSDYVVVTVLGPDGKPATDITISSGVRIGQAQQGGGQGNKRPDGTWWVAHASRPNSEEGGIYFVSVYSAVWGSMEVTYEKKLVSEVLVRFAEPANLVVTITGLENHPYADHLSVSVVKDGETAQPYGEQPANRKEWTFGPLVPGKYEVRLFAITKDEYWGASSVAEETVQLNSGKNTVTLAAPRLYKLKVTMPKKEEVSVYLQKEGETQNYGIYVQTDENGVAEFGPLAAGRYTLTNYNDGTVMNVNVPDQLDVKWEAVKINAWRVDVKDQNGYGATLGLLSGDMLVGINGTDFENQNQMWMLLQNAEDKQNVKFTVQRGAAKLEITADYLKLFDPSKSGCTLTPAAR